MSDRFLVSLKGVRTPEERQFAKNPNGIEMVKRMRQNLISQGRDKLCKQISDITGTDVSGLFTDIEPQIGERVIMFTLAKDFDPHFR